MTNRLAIILALVILALIALDQILAEGAGLLFLGKKFLNLIHWLAFWR